MLILIGASAICAKHRDHFIVMIQELAAKHEINTSFW